MTKTTALAIQIVTGDARPIFRQIVDGIRKEIASGALPTGSKLPSVRGLAMQLTINANTVAKAYNELTDLGLVESKKGLGLFVTQQQCTLSEDERTQKLEQATDDFINEIISLGFSHREIIEHVQGQLQTINKQDKER